MSQDGLLKRLLASGDYSDCVITCGSDKYRLHKAVICSQSSFFEKAFSVEMKEKATGHFKLDADCPDAVKSMIDWIYTKDYKGPCPTTAAHQPKQCDCLPNRSSPSTHDDFWDDAFRTAAKKNCHPLYSSASTGQPVAKPLSVNGAQLLHHARVYVLGDFYGLEGLRGLAITKFRDGCEQGCSASTFPEAAHEVYNTTPDTDRGLRNIVVDTIIQHRKLIDMPEVQSVIQQTQLAFDLVIAAHHRGAGL